MSYIRYREELIVSDNVALRSTKQSKPACTYCKKKHTKCNRGTPCETCFSKGVECVYVQPVKKKQPKQISAEATTRALLKQKQEEAAYWRQMYEKTQNKNIEKQLHAWQLAAHLCTATDVSSWLHFYKQSLEQRYSAPLVHWNANSIMEALQDDELRGQPESAELLSMLALAARVTGHVEKGEALDKATKFILADEHEDHPCIASAFILIGDYKMISGDIKEVESVQQKGLSMISRLRTHPKFGQLHSLSSMGYLHLMTKRVCIYSDNFITNRAVELANIKILMADLMHLMVPPFQVSIFSAVIIWSIFAKVWLTISIYSPQQLCEHNKYPCYNLQSISKETCAQFLYELEHTIEFSLASYGSANINHRHSMVSAQFCKALTYYAAGFFDHSLRQAKYVVSLLMGSYGKAYSPSMAVCLLFDIGFIAVQLGDGPFFVEVFVILFTDFKKYCNEQLRALLELADNCGLVYSKDRILDMMLA
mmetsp:Transcript_28149/g.31273  ORF Transcript_28149/g.31273 Transcript_28149/m.31273 type:complete len:480 (-) Transcript_28149:36-1475(-)